MKIMKTPKTFFFHGITKDKHRFTLCGKEGKSFKWFICSISICSKNDIFVKKIGRNIAEGRLNKKVHTVKFRVENKSCTETIINLGTRLSHKSFNSLKDFFKL